MFIFIKYKSILDTSYSGLYISDFSSTLLRQALR